MFLTGASFSTFGTGGSCNITYQSIISINQLYLNTVNGSANWFSDMPRDNHDYKL